MRAQRFVVYIDHDEAKITEAMYLVAVDIDDALKYLNQIRQPRPTWCWVRQLYFWVPGMNWSVFCYVSDEVYSNLGQGHGRADFLSSAVGFGDLVGCPFIERVVQDDQQRRLDFSAQEG